MKVSICCGEPGETIHPRFDDMSYEELGICRRCGERTEYIDDNFKDKTDEDIPFENITGREEEGLPSWEDLERIRDEVRKSRENLDE